ncbi:MAG: hypothetical protein KDC34_02100 [Saprospiraceae bacterium]|nr:hypothetical protein [Saprospiraceae bacterium]
MKNILFLVLLSSLIWGCSKSDSANPQLQSDVGVAGSYARFIIKGDFMYVVDESNLITFSLADPTTPVQVHTQPIGESVETVYQLNDRLFIGSGSGLYLYTIGQDGLPVFAGEYLYSNFGFDIEPCDPVVANDSVAYVTLNTTNRVTRCRVNTTMGINLLNIFDIKDFNNPVLISQYEMVNPKGVGLDGTILFVCDGEDGLKVFDVADPYNIQLLHHFPGFEAYDVIPLNGLLLVIGPDNIYQYDYSELVNMIRISTIPVGV